MLLDNEDRRGRGAGPSRLGKIAVLLDEDKRRRPLGVMRANLGEANEVEEGFAAVCAIRDEISERDLRTGLWVVIQMGFLFLFLFYK